MLPGYMPPGSMRGVLARTSLLTDTARAVSARSARQACWQWLCSCQAVRSCWLGA